MCNAGVNTLTFIRMGIFIEGDTDQRVRWNEIVQTIFDLTDECTPVSVISLKNLEFSIGFVVLCVPNELVFHLADVLWRMDEMKETFALLLLGYVSNEISPRFRFNRSLHVHIL